MVYCLVSLVARKCCIFCYLKSVEISPGFSVSCYHSREIRVYAYIQFNPVSYVWGELFCYGCLLTIFPYFLSFLCSFFYFAVQRTLWNPVEGDRNVSVCMCVYVCVSVGVCVWVCVYYVCVCLCVCVCVCMYV